MNAAQWRKSSRSSDKGDACIEVAGMTAGVAIRDSKDRDGGIVQVESGAFHRLLDCIRDSEMP